MAAKKNSLVANINRRKRAGTSRPRSRSTIASQAYQDMQAGWPRRKTAKKKAAGKKSGKRAVAKKSGKRAAGKKSGKRAAGKKSGKRGARKAES